MSRSTTHRTAGRPFARRAVAALIAVVLGVLASVVGVAPAYADGNVTGRLVDQFGDPVPGISFDIVNNVSTVHEGTFTSGTDGTFSVPLYSADFILVVLPGALDANSKTYDYFVSPAFSIGSTDNPIGDVVLHSLVTVEGTITNWVPTMLSVDYEVVDQTTDATVTSGTSTDGTFLFGAPLDPGADYTMYFSLDPSSSAPYLDAYLGGEFFDSAAADTIPATTGGAVTGIAMVMPDAALISGTVTDSVTHLGIPNITVSTDDRPDFRFHAEAETDADGDYELRVIPGLTYSVYADDFDTFTYLSMTYDGLDGCGCAFTPVDPTLVTPAAGIDFALEDAATAVSIIGQLEDDSPSPLDNVQVHLYRPVSGGWAEVDVTQSDSSGFFDLALSAFGRFRMRFELGGTWLPVTDGLAASGSASAGDPISGCFVDTGTLDSSSVLFGVAFAMEAILDPAGGCGPEPAPSGTSGGGTSTSGHPRPHAGPAGRSSIVTPTPTPTPTSTPTPSSSPSASPSASPSPSVTPHPVPSDATGFPWWIILIIVLLVGAAILIIVLVRRR